MAATPGSGYGGMGTYGATPGGDMDLAGGGGVAAGPAYEHFVGVQVRIL